LALKKRSEDLEELPEQFADAMAHFREANAERVNTIFHNVMRYRGDTTTTDLDQVARLQGSLENPYPPDAHEVGMLTHRAGRYMVRTVVRYRDANSGKMAQKVYTDGSFFVGEEYEKIEKPAEAPAVPAPAAADTAAENSLKLVEGLVNLVVKLNGSNAQTTTPPDVSALQAALETERRNNDARIQRLTDEFTQREERLRKAIKVDNAAAPAESFFTPTKLEEYAGAAGSALKVGKGLMDLLKPAAAPAVEAAE